MIAIQRLTKTGFALLVLCGLCGLHSTARADHDSFEYRGQCFNVPGEREMICALNTLEQAYNTPVAAQQLVRKAAWEASQAHDRLCDPQAQFYLRGAVDHMDRFVLYRDVCDLNDAARLIGKALHAEQCARGHHPPVAPVVGNHVGHGHIGQIHGFRPVPPPIVHQPVPRSRGGLFIGGKHGGLHIKF